MSPVRLFAMLSVVGLLGSLPACADGNGNANDEPQATQEGALEGRRTQASDAAIKSKLGEILRGVTFMSESDYPFTVIEADGNGVKRLSAKAVRTNLSAILKDKTSSNRDVMRRGVRQEKLAIADAIRDSELTGEDERDARQAGLAVKYMTEQLKGVVGFTFGTNESGDQDEFGPVVYVYVGISRTTGKLIGIFTEAVYT